VDDVQVTRVAVAVADVAACFAVIGLVEGVRALIRLLRAFPRGPSFPFYAVDLLDLDLAGQVEVADGRQAPLGLNLLEIEADGRLFDSYALGNLALRQSLEIEIGDLLSTSVDRDASTAADRHL